MPFFRNQTDPRRGMQRILCGLLGLSLLACGAFSEEPYVLDNGQVRVEIDPALFAIRFVGLSGGDNFLELVYVSELERQGSGWVACGGLVTDVVPLEAPSPLLRRGPAEVVYLSERSVLLVGPEDPALGLRLEKEIALEKDAPRVRYTVRVLTTRPESRQVAVRNIARIPIGSKIQFCQADQKAFTLTGIASLEAVAELSGIDWVVSMPPKGLAGEGAITAPGTETSLTVNGVTWHRQFAPASETDIPSVVQGVFDVAHYAYQHAVQSQAGTLEMGTPFAFTELWFFDRAGKGDAAVGKP